MRIDFDRAKPRGAKVSGYFVRCINGSGHTLTERRDRSPLTVAGLRGRTAYDCRVRATSKGGPGPGKRIHLGPR